MQGADVTYQADSDVDSRGKFTRDGKLFNGQQDPKLRLISDNSTVFAISRDLGTIQATTDPVVWAIGFTTDPAAVNYSDLSGAPPIPRSPYYKIQYSNDADLASVDSNCWEDYMSNIKSRSLTFSTISATRPQELKIWTTKYSRMPDLSHICLEAWSLLQSTKYSAACS
jgi:hypothetical protein